MANIYGFPPAAEKEKERVRKKLNPRGRGILTEMAAPSQSPPAISDPFTAGLPQQERDRLAALQLSQSAPKTPEAQAAPPAQGRHLGSIAGPYTPGPRIDAPQETPQTAPVASPAPARTPAVQNPPPIQTASITAALPEEQEQSPSIAAVPQEPFRPAMAGQRVYAPAYNATYGSVAQQRQEFNRQQQSSIIDPLEQAQIDNYTASAEKARAESTPEYLAAKGQAGRQEMMTKLIGTNESLYKSILQNLKDSPEASKYTPQQLTQLAREEAWKSTLDTFQRVGGLFTDAQGNETEDGQRLKEGFEQYRRALVNLDQRRDSGQLDEQAYNKEYRALNQKWMDIRDAQKKTPTITS